MKNTRQIQVFLAEDNVADVWLVEEALKRQMIDYQLALYSTAEDAILAAKACGFEDAQIPDLMLVDIELPGMDGLSLTRRVKMNPSTRDIVVLALSGRAGADDQLLAESLRQRAVCSRCRSLQGDRVCGDECSFPPIG